MTVALHDVGNNFDNYGLLLQITVVRHAARIGDAMTEAMVATAAPGVSEADTRL